MSAYGEIKRAHNAAPLLPTEWKGLAAANAEHGTHITVHHLTLASARALPGLIAYLSAVFAQEVEDGMTYPQEGDMSQTTFEAYFFAADVFIGLIGQLTSDAVTRTATSLTDDYTTGVIETQRGGRNWDQCVAGFYYICNAGFVVPPTQRGMGYGSLLSHSYVHYAPKLGYQASVFNLVYVNNSASVRLWEKLGFTKAGRIPRAGRLRTKDGQGEEYVDAWVFYKSFIDSDA